MTQKQTEMIDISPSAGELTPAGVQELMKLAITEGRDNAVDQLERLVGLAERVADRQARADFNTAYAQFRSECPVIRKTKEAKVATGGGSAWSWWYAPLEAIQKIVDPILKRHGLFYSFSNDESEDGKTRVICTLRHVGGHSEASSVTIRKGGSNQRMSPGQQDAGTLTTAMRRVLAMTLGLATSDAEDPDADPMPQDLETITDQQLNELETVLSQLPPATKSRLLKAAHIDNLADLPARAYEQTYRLLCSKLEGGQE